MNNREKMDKNFISSVVYLNTADSADSLRVFLEKLLKNMSEKWAKYELILVDDDTSGELLDVAKAAKKLDKEASITILHMSSYQGMEMTYL